MPKSRSILFAVIAAISAATTGAMGQDQPEGLPWIAPEFLDDTRKLDDDELTFCLNTDSALVAFDRAVAEAIGDVLLLDVSFYELVNPSKAYRYDFRLPLNEAQLFMAMTNNCDAVMGYRLTPNTLPAWLTVSRPYFESKVVFLSSNAGYRSLSDLPDGEKIGVRMGATGHRELRSHLDALPETQRPSQVPYPDNELLIARLRDGTVSTVFIWELAPAFAAGGDLEGLGVKSAFDAPFPVQPLLFGIAMAETDTFVRGLIDDAIEELTSSGVLAELAAQHLPALDGSV